MIGFVSLLCFAIPVFVVVMPLCAFYFRLNCSIYNCLVGGAGSPRSIPEPSYRAALNISFTTSIIMTLATMVAGSLAGSVPRHLEEVVLFLVVGGSGFCIWFSQTIRCLPTSYGRAFVVSVMTWGTAAALWFVSERSFIPILNRWIDTAY